MSKMYEFFIDCCGQDSSFKIFFYLKLSTHLYNHEQITKYNSKIPKKKAEDTLIRLRKSNYIRASPITSNDSTGIKQLKIIYM